MLTLCNFLSYNLKFEPRKHHFSFLVSNWSFPRQIRCQKEQVAWTPTELLWWWLLSEGWVPFSSHISPGSLFKNSSGSQKAQTSKSLSSLHSLQRASDSPQKTVPWVFILRKLFCFAVYSIPSSWLDPVLSYLSSLSKEKNPLPKITGPWCFLFSFC